MYRYALKFHKKMKYKDCENFSNCTDNIIPKYKLESHNTVTLKRFTESIVNTEETFLFNHWHD